MTGARGGSRRRTFDALAVRNFRLYFFGQIVSLSGTWMQRVAQAWLVLELTGSGTAVGGVTAFQYLPFLVLSPLAGIAADRFDKRRLLYFTQTGAGLVAASLAALVLADRVELWMVYVLALLLGAVDSFDNPVRNAFVIEMVGPERLTNAVGLNSVLINLARVVGPAIGGGLIVTVGIGLCFAINSLSYVGFVIALTLMRPGELLSPEKQSRRPGKLREALAYARREPEIRVPLLMLAVLSVFVFEYEVTVPLLARFTFDGNADTFGLMFAMLGVGAVIGGLSVAGLRRAPAEMLVRMAVGLGGALLLASLAPTLGLALGALLLVGAAGTSFLIVSNSALQLAAAPGMGGRVMALRAMAFLGARPLGAPILGWVAERFGARYALGVGAFSALAIATWAARRHPTSRSKGHHTMARTKRGRKSQ